MTTFVDTSAIFAAADRDDAHHITARDTLVSLVESAERLVTHSYVLSETAALLQRRLGLAAASHFLDEIDLFDVVWVDRDLHLAGARELRRRRSRTLSLVDCVSFALMRSRSSIRRAFAFDRDFASAGFDLTP